MKALNIVMIVLYIAVSIMFLYAGVKLGGVQRLVCAEIWMFGAGIWFAMFLNKIIESE